MQLIDDHVRAVGREVRELARLHGELVHVELRGGARRLIAAVLLVGFGIMMAGLVVVAFGFALFAWLSSLLTTPSAALIVALGFAATMMLSWWMSWRLLRGAKSLLLPQTRTMLWELLRWRDVPTNSSAKSAPADEA